jgi:7-carboxy-7-deazaguanine synthase
MFLRLGGCDGVSGMRDWCSWCWEKGTKVLKKGVKQIKLTPIEGVSIGDKVLSFDGIKDAWTEVTDISSRKTDLIVEIGYESGKGTRKVRVTPEHPFHISGKWVTAENIRPGMEITTSSSEVWQFIHNGAKVKYVLFLPGEFEVYDLHCSPHHNYYGNWLLGHNCDSMHAVDPVHKAQWTWMAPQEIKEAIYTKAPWCRNLTISGGNPALHDLEDLLDILIYFGYSVNVETQGTMFRPWIARCETITVSPKPPSAGSWSSVKNLDRFLLDLILEVDRLDPDYRPPICIKVVVDVNDGRDYRFAKQVHQAIEQFDYFMPFYLSIKTDPDDTPEKLLSKYRGMAEVVCQDMKMPDVFILPQVHFLLWGSEKGR